jgi:hypothetical protein
MPSASASSSPSTFSGGHGERTAQDVHDTLCAMVMAEAEKHEAWADYEAVLLDDETAAFFAARLPEAKAKAAGGESESPPSKKRKKQAFDSGEATNARDDAAEDITLRVACLDGSSLELTVPPRELVREVKKTLGQVGSEREREIWLADDVSQRVVVTNSQNGFCFHCAWPALADARCGPWPDRALCGR